MRWDDDVEKKILVVVVGEVLKLHAEKGATQLRTSKKYLLQKRVVETGPKDFFGGTFCRFSIGTIIMATILGQQGY